MRHRTATAPRHGLSIRGVEREYALDHRKISAAIASGTLPAARFGKKRFLLLRVDVERWIAGHAVTPSARSWAESAVREDRKGSP